MARSRHGSPLHPNIITIYEVANDGERVFIAMELVRGQPLDQIIGRKALSLERAIACGIPGASLFPAISRDGKLVTYVSDRAASDTMDVWVQQIEGGDPVQLTRGLGACRDPAFSPDGSKIVAHWGPEPGAIYVVPTLGGLPKRVAEVARWQTSRLSRRFP